jgi:hypothetical protein
MNTTIPTSRAFSTQNGYVMDLFIFIMLYQKIFAEESINQI